MRLINFGDLFEDVHGMPQAPASNPYLGMI